MAAGERRKDAQGGSQATLPLMDKKETRSGPRGQVVSERHAAQSVDVARTHRHTHRGTEETLTGASASPDGPSVWPFCPAGRPASGAHRSLAHFYTSSLAGGWTGRRVSSPKIKLTLFLSSRCATIQERKRPPSIRQIES